MRLLVVAALLAVECGSIDAESAAARGNVSGSCPRADLRESPKVGDGVYYSMEPCASDPLTAICGVASESTDQIIEQHTGCDIIQADGEAVNCVRACPK